MADLPVQVQPTVYTVSLLPLDHFDAHVFAVTVEWRGEGRWAVKWAGRCLSVDGRWDYESIPSERTDEWLATHRFTCDEALERAKQVAPTIVVNGHRVQDVVARAAAEAAQ